MELLTNCNSRRFRSSLFIRLIHYQPLNGSIQIKIKRYAQCCLHRTCVTKLRSLVVSLKLCMKRCDIDERMLNHPIKWMKWLWNNEQSSDYPKEVISDPQFRWYKHCYQFIGNLFYCLHERIFVCAKWLLRTTKYTVINLNGTQHRLMQTKDGGDEWMERMGKIFYRRCKLNFVPFVWKKSRIAAVHSPCHVAQCTHSHIIIVVHSFPFSGIDFTSIAKYFGDSSRITGIDTHSHTLVLVIFVQLIETVQRDNLVCSSHGNFRREQRADFPNPILAFVWHISRCQILDRYHHSAHIAQYVRLSKHINWNITFRSFSLNSGSPFLQEIVNRARLI